MLTRQSVSFLAAMFLISGTWFSLLSSVRISATFCALSSGGRGEYMAFFFTTGVCFLSGCSSVLGINSHPGLEAWDNRQFANLMNNYGIEEAVLPNFIFTLSVCTFHAPKHAHLSLKPRKLAHNSNPGFYSQARLS